MTVEEVLAEIKSLGFETQTWSINAIDWPHVDKRVREYHVKATCEHGVVYKLSSTVSMPDAIEKMLGVIKTVSHKEA